MSALLHALVLLTLPQFQLRPLTSGTTSTLVDDLNDDIPVAYLPCQWKPPKQRKESTLPIAQAKFEKHTFGTI